MKLSICQFFIYFGLTLSGNISGNHDVGSNSGIRNISGNHEVSSTSGIRNITSSTKRGPPPSLFGLSSSVSSSSSMSNQTQNQVPFYKFKGSMMSKKSLDTESEKIQLPSPWYGPVPWRVGQIGLAFLGLGLVFGLKMFVIWFTPFLASAPIKAIQSAIAEETSRQLIQDVVMKGVTTLQKLYG